ncbi:MAG: ABC transporter ATP-binding protein [Culicoidibacterales bacterium]
MWKVLKNLKPYWFVIVGIFVLTFANAMSQLLLPSLMANIVDFGIVNGDISYILRYGGFMLLIAIFGTTCTIFAAFQASKLSARLGTILREKVFHKVESFSLAEFNKFGTASLLTRTTNDITQVQQVVLMMLRMMLMAPMMMIGGIIMTIVQDQRMSLILVVILPVVVAIIVVIGWLGLPLFQTIQKKLDQVNLIFRENLTGVRVIRAFNQQQHEQVRFEQANQDLTQTSIQANQIIALLMPTLSLVINLSTIVILWLGAGRIGENTLAVGELMAFIQYVGQILFSVTMISMVFSMLPRAIASANRIQAVIETENSIVDPQVETNLPQVAQARTIRFEQVSFAYPKAEEAVLSKLSFEAKAGEVTAIIGGTGSGKSTLLNLITRFYDPTNGKIFLDDIDIRHLSQTTLRSTIGYIPQKAVLFSGTVSENIRYGKSEATMQEVEQAAKLSQSFEFISQMREGFDSHIAQGGSNVSGGQKQRLSIARALVRQAGVYLFDDSFSALDFKTDAKLRQSLKSMEQQATMIIVAQRISTIKDADQILVLDQGRIVGQGKHTELLQTCPVYQEIAYSQLSQEELA